MRMLIAGVIVALAGLAVDAPASEGIGAPSTLTTSLECHGCASCQSDEYSVPAIGGDDTWWITFETYQCPNYPFDQPCGWGCSPLAGELAEAAALAAAQEDSEAIQALLERNPAELYWAQERNAIHVLDCGNRVVAQIKVSPAMAADLD